MLTVRLSEETGPFEGNIQRRPYRAAAAYLCLITIAILLWFPEPLSLPGGMSLVTLVMVAGLVYAVRGIRSRTQRLLDATAMRFAAIAVTCGAFVLFWSNLSVVGAPEPLRSGRVIVTHFSGAAILLLLYATFTAERARTLIGLTLLLAAFVSLLSFLAYFNTTLFSILFADRDRSNGFFKHSNQYGIVLSTVAPVGLALALSARSRFVWLVLAGATAFGFIAAGSKTNLLIFSASATFLLLCTPLLAQNATMRMVNFLRNLGLGAGVAALGVAGLSTFNPRAVRILAQFFSEDSEVRSLLSRKGLWDFSLDQFVNHPFVGQGTGQMIPIHYGDGFISHSHNVILDYMRMLGVPGLAVCLVLLLAAIYALCATIHLACVTRGARYDHRLMTMGLAVGGLAYIAANMSSDSFGPSTSPFFWLVTYLALFMRTVIIREHASYVAPKAAPHFGSIRHGLTAQKGSPGCA